MRRTHEVNSWEIRDGASAMGLHDDANRRQIEYILKLEKRIESLEETLEAMRKAFGRIGEKEEEDDDD